MLWFGCSTIYIMSDRPTTIVRTLETDTEPLVKNLNLILWATTGFYVSLEYLPPSPFHIPQEESVSGWNMCQNDYTKRSSDSSIKYMFLNRRVKRPVQVIPQQFATSFRKQSTITSPHVSVLLLFQNQNRKELFPNM